MKKLCVLFALLLAAARPAAAEGTTQTPQGTLASLTVAGLSPAFSPTVTQYTIPRTTCAVPVTATLANPTVHRLYIQSAETASGAMRQAWVCDGKTKIDIVVYLNWTEVGRYTITVIGAEGSTSSTGSSSGGSSSTPPPTPPPPTEPNPTPTPVSAISIPLPAPVAVDTDTAVTFLNEASFGPTAADVALVKANGPDYWFTQQLQAPKAVIAPGIDINELRKQVFLNMANAPDQLRQRVVWALSQILVVSANKNVNGGEVQPFVAMLHKYAFTNYRTLLRETTLSPAMGKYLDLVNSQKATPVSSPNENYPRELMQLFSLGVWQLNQDGSRKLDAYGQPIPTYDQNTIREVARALTGWTYPTAPGQQPKSLNPTNFNGLMEPRPANHDMAAKTIFGTTIPANQTVTQDLESTIDIIFNHPNMPPFLATRLIRSLVTSNPSPGYIQRVADKFVDNGAGVRGDMQAVLRAVLFDAEAVASGQDAGRLKDPVLHIIGMGRALGAQINDPSMFLYIFSNLGEQVLTSTTVFGFYSPLASLPQHPTMFGPEFQLYTPALALQRANFIYDILSGQMQSAFYFDLNPYIAAAGNPFALVDKVNQTLMFGRMSTELKQLLVSLAQSTSDPRNRALGTLYLAAISSEYAVFTGGPVQ